MCDWSMDMCLLLIDYYEQHPVLWDSKDPYYYSKNKKMDAWEAIAQSLNLDVKIVRQKMVSLLGSFRAQRSKGKKSVGTGANKKDVYISKWFAFERMHFLLDKDDPKNSTKYAEHTEAGNSDLINESRPSSPLSDEYYHEPTTVIETYDSSNTMLLDNEQSNLTADETDDCNSMQQENSSMEKETRRALPPPKKTRKMESQNTHRIEQTLDMPRDARCVTSRAQYVPFTQDRFTTYGEHVANKLRTYSTKTQAIVEHAINNILFMADMGNYEKFQADDPMIYNHFLKCPVVSSSTASCNKSEPL